MNNWYVSTNGVKINMPFIQKRLGYQRFEVYRRVWEEDIKT